MLYLINPLALVSSVGYGKIGEMLLKSQASVLASHLKKVVFYLHMFTLHFTVTASAPPATTIALLNAKKITFIRKIVSF